MISGEQISSIIVAVYVLCLGVLLHAAYRMRRTKKWARSVIDFALTLSFHGDRIIPFGVILCYVLGLVALVWTAIDIVRDIR